MKTKEQKRKEAEIRQDAVRNVPASVRIALLDKNGLTATWERHKLARLLIKENEKTGKIEQVVIPGIGNQRPHSHGFSVKKKLYQKPKKS